ncbi:MAG: YdeI/OmpD-associated family protein [Planctomycetota bacterium]
MDYYPHKYETTVERFGVGKTKVLWYTVVFLPDEIRSDLPFDRYPRLRVEGEIEEVPIANAFMPTGDGRYYLIVSPKVLKDAEVEVGDVVRIRFRVADQNHVEVPPALQRAINVDHQVAKAWDTLTPGRKRMLAQHVMSAKTPKTQTKRLNEALEALIEHKADLREWRRSKRN